MMIVITIGFNSTTYTVRESNGSTLLDVSLKSGIFDEYATAAVRFITVNGSADSKPSHKHTHVIVHFCMLEVV